MVRDVDGQEADVENSLALREGDTALVETSGGHDLAEGGSETVERLGGTSNNEHGRGVEERDANLGVLGKEGVDLLDVALEGLAAQAVNGEHGGGGALVVGSGVGNDLGLNGNNGEGLLTTETNEEQKADGLGNVGLERSPRVGGSDGNGRDETLRVTGSTTEERTELSGVNVSHLTGDPVLGELGGADQRERQGDRGEVFGGGAGSSAAEPADKVKTLRVVGESVGVGLLGERDKDLLGELLEVLLDEGAVDVEERLELIEVGL